jgi:arginase family enzyme
VEVAPAYDVGDITSLAAAHVAHEWLALYAARKLNSPA